MLPDPGCYEERYRLTSSAVLGLIACLLAIGLGVLWHTPVVFAEIAVILAALATRNAGALGAARRMLAFRADQAGITLGAMPGKLPPRHGSAVSVPWADVEQIILYPAYPRGGRYAEIRCIGIQRRDGAAALPWGNEQAPHCPAPGVAKGVTRRISGWRLDRERLAAVTAAVAPGIRIIDASTSPGPAVAGPSQSASASEPGPAD